MDRRSLVLALLLASGLAAAQPFPAETSPPSVPLYEQAANAERDGDMQAAIKLYVRAARMGEGKAAGRLGEIYGQGIGGVPRDEVESAKWHNAARVLGHPPLIGDFPQRR
jgi:TPR repeat protein